MSKNACERIGRPQSMPSSNLILPSNTWTDGVFMYSCAMRKRAKRKEGLGETFAGTWTQGIQSQLVTYIVTRKFAGERKQ
jgi:hypothetical protein